MKTGILAVAKAEFINIFSNSRTFVVLLLPVLLFTFYGSILSKGSPNQLPVAILDQDHTQLSRELIRMLGATSSISIAQYAADEQEAAMLMRSGKVFAFVLIPNDFQKEVYRGNTATAMFYENNEFLTPGGVLSKAFLSATGSLSASLRVNSLLNQGQSIEQAKVAIQPVNLDTHVLFNPFSNYTWYLCLALLPMSLQFVVMLTTVYVLGKVFKNHHGKELYALSGNNVWSALWGKLLPYTLFFSIIIFYMLSYMFGYLGIPLNGDYLTVFLITLLLVLVYQLMAVFFVSTGKEFRSVATSAGGYSALAFTFAGYTFPAEGMPKAIQVMDYIFPFTSYARMYVSVVMRGNPIKYSMPLFIGLLVFATIGLLSVPKFSKLLQKGGYDA